MSLFQKRQDLTELVAAFFFEKPLGFTFFPGQYLTLSLPSAQSPYDFTISSSPLDEDFLMIITRKSSTEYKQLLFSLVEGSMVSIDGPFGGFYLRETDSSPKVLLAGGMGITPFISMIRFYAQKKLLFPLTLIATFSTQQDMVYYKELTGLEKDNKNLSVRYSITREKGEWKGAHGRITETFLREMIFDIPTPYYYICGSPNMGESVEELLESIGVPEEKIRVELF